MSREQRRQVVVEYLKECGGRCPGCGYELRGIPEDRCPECGNPVRLTVDPRTAARGWWLAAVLGTGAAAAMWFVALGDSMRQMWAHQATTDPMLVQFGMAPQLRLQWRTIEVMAVALTVTLALTAWAIASRARFAGWPWWLRAVVGSLLGAGPVWAVVVMWWFGGWGR